MDLILIRHAIAEDRADFALSNSNDEQRPLTELGQKRMKNIASYLKTKIKTPHLILTSPLIRARQTTDILLQYFQAPVEINELLKPEQSPDLFYSYIRKTFKKEQLIFAVGHEPLLNQIVSFSLTKNSSSLCQLKKGGIAHLTNMHSQPYLKSLLTPKTMLKE